MPSAHALRLAALIVRHGGVIAYPTEAVYGLGCDPADREAVERLLALKRRAVHHGLILIAASSEQLSPYTAPLDRSQRRRIEAETPISWVVPAAPLAPGWITGAHDSIAVRVTHHPVARALCEACGHPLVSTSANHAGRPSARTALAVRQRFGAELDYIVSAPVGGLQRPTSIRDLATGEVLR